MAIAAQAEWSNVWHVYLENQGVFQDVFGHLRQMGHIVLDTDEDELLHEFLTTRLREALTTFRPEKGKLHSWLYVVFKRFVIGRYRQRHRHQELLRKFAEGFRHLEIDPVRRVDVTRVRTIVEQLADNERQALAVYFGEKPSLRAVARALEIPRWRADDLVWTAVARVVLAMDADVGVPEHALRRYVDPKPSERVARQEVQRALKALLGRQRSVTGEERMLESNENVEPTRSEELERGVTCKDVDAFLAGKRPVSSPSAARALLGHAATCSPCASRLREHELHVEALLAASRVLRAETLGDEDASDAVVAAEQQEILAVARAVHETLTEVERKALEGCDTLSSEHRADLWMLEREEQEVPDVLFRLALAVTEATQSLSTLLCSTRGAEGRVNLQGDPVVFTWLVDPKLELKDLPPKNVPRSYFAHQLASRADLPAELAEAVWRAFVMVSTDGRVGVPGLHLEEDAGRGYLVLAD